MLESAVDIFDQPIMFLFFSLFAVYLSVFDVFLFLIKIWICLISRQLMNIMI